MTSTDTPERQLRARWVCRLLEDALSELGDDHCLLMAQKDVDHALADTTDEEPSDRLYVLIEILLLHLERWRERTTPARPGGPSHGATRYGIMA